MTFFPGSPAILYHGSKCVELRQCMSRFQCVVRVFRCHILSIIMYTIIIWLYVLEVLWRLSKDVSNLSCNCIENNFEKWLKQFK